MHQIISNYEHSTICYYATEECEMVIEVIHADVVCVFHFDHI